MFSITTLLELWFANDLLALTSRWELSGMSLEAFLQAPLSIKQPVGSLWATP